MTVNERVADATKAYETTEQAWHSALERAFGQQASERRYDFDQRDHPAECRALYAAHAVTSDEFHRAWAAKRDAARQEQIA